MCPEQRQDRHQGGKVIRPYTDVGVIFQRDALLEWRTVIENVLLQIDVRGLTASMQGTQDLMVKYLSPKDPPPVSGLFANEFLG